MLLVVTLMNKTGNVLWRNTGVRSPNNSCHRKSICITNSECVFLALVTQHVKRMSCTILLRVECLDLPHFSTLSHKGTVFGKSYGIQKPCFNLICRLCRKNFLFKEEFSEILYFFSCKVPIICARYWWHFNFIDRFSKNPQILISRKSIKWNTNLMQHCAGFISAESLYMFRALAPETCRVTLQK